MFLFYLWSYIIHESKKRKLQPFELDFGPWNGFNILNCFFKAGLSNTHAVSHPIFRHWYVICDTWYMMCDMSCVIDDMSCTVYEMCYLICDMWYAISSKPDYFKAWSREEKFLSSSDIVVCGYWVKHLFDIAS